MTGEARAEKAGLGCLMRDPQFAWCYWGPPGEAIERVAAERGQKFVESCRWALRVTPSGGQPHDVEVDAGARSWYLKVKPGRKYLVELCLVSAEGEHIVVVGGGRIEAPEEPQVRPTAVSGALREEARRILAATALSSHVVRPPSERRRACERRG